MKTKRKQNKRKPIDEKCKIKLKDKIYVMNVLNNAWIIMKQK